MSKYPIESLGFAANGNQESDMIDPIEALIMASTSEFIPKSENLKVKSEILRYDGKETTCTVVYLGKSPYQVGWIKDADVKVCMACTGVFSFFKRKHHCRKCGFVVCNSCSQDRLVIPELQVSEPKGSRVCTSCSHQQYLDNKRKIESIKDNADPNSMEALLEKWKSVTKSNNTSAINGLSKEQLKEKIGNTCAKIMEDICAGTAYPATYPIVEVKVQHFEFMGVSRSWNRVYLTGTKYNIGWIFYRDHAKCMICTVDFTNTSKPMTRTHCRMCGYMICTKCASNKILIDEFLETDGSDCCLKCFEFLKPKLTAEVTNSETVDKVTEDISNPNAAPAGHTLADNGTDTLSATTTAVDSASKIPEQDATASELINSSEQPSESLPAGSNDTKGSKKIDKNQAMIDKLSKLNASFN